MEVHRVLPIFDCLNPQNVPLKSLFAILGLFISVSYFAQTEQLLTYNLAIVDSCIARLDSSISIVSLRYINGSDRELEHYFFERLSEVDYIQKALTNRLLNIPEGHRWSGIDIAVYLDSKSCMITGSDYMSDEETGELLRIQTGDHYQGCFTFKAEEPVLPCKAN